MRCLRSLIDGRVRSRVYRFRLAVWLRAAARDRGQNISTSRPGNDVQPPTHANRLLRGLRPFVNCTSVTIIQVLFHLSCSSENCRSCRCASAMPSPPPLSRKQGSLPAMQKNRESTPTTTRTSFAGDRGSDGLSLYFISRLYEPPMFHRYHIERCDTQYPTSPLNRDRPPVSMDLARHMAASLNRRQA